MSHCCNLDYRGLKAIADLSRLTSLCLSDVDFERERPLGVMSEAAMLMRTSFILLVSQLSGKPHWHIQKYPSRLPAMWSLTKTASCPEDLTATCQQGRFYHVEILAFRIGVLANDGFYVEQIC